MKQRLRVLLLGPLTVEHGLKKIEVKGKLQQVLLARLALSAPTPVSAQTLIEDLWAGNPPRRERHALHAQISRLRGTLPIEIERIDDTYYFPAHSISTDAAEFTTFAANARDDMARQRPLSALQGFDHALKLWRDQIPLHIAEAGSLRQITLGLNEALRTAQTERIDAAILAGRSAEVIADLTTSLETDAFNERGWGQLMRALQDVGRPHDALQAFMKARNIFVQELGTEPGRELQEIQAEILSSTTLKPPARQRATQSPFPPPAHLVGRESEWGHLVKALNDEQSGIRIVTLSGAPGIGKSALARAFINTTRDLDYTVLDGYSDVSVRRPYAPFAGMLRRYFDAHPECARDARLTPHAAGLARVLPEYASNLGVSQRGHQAHASGPDYRALGAIIAWLRALSETERIVVLLEDIHLSDPASIVLLQKIARNHEGINALLILTLSDSPSWTEGTSASEFLVQSERITRLDLRPLGKGGLAALVANEAARHYSTDVPSWIPDYVARTSSGNPLIAIELVRYLSASDTHAPPPAVPVPLGLRQVLLERLTTFTHFTQDLLPRASIIGSPFNAQLLSDITGESDQNCEEAIQEGLRARILEESSPGASTFTFSHDVVRAAFTDTLSLSERVTLHGRVAEAYERWNEESSVDLVFLAHHHLRSNSTTGRRAAYSYLMQAGAEALKCSAPVDAVAHFRQALELVDDDRHQQERCDALIELGCAELQAALPSYRETLLDAARIAMELEDSARLFRAVLANSRGWWSSAISVDHDRLEAIETALAWCDPSDQTTRSLLLGSWAVESVRDSSIRDRVMMRSRESLNLAEATGDISVIATALMQRYTVLSAIFEGFDESLHVNERLLSLSQQLADRNLRLSALVGLTQMHLLQGNVFATDRYLMQGLKLAEALQDPPRIWLLSGWNAMRELMRGNVDKAEAIIHEVHDFGRRSHQQDAFTWYAGQLFTLRMMQGRLGELVDELRAHVPQVEGTIPAWRAAMALALAEAGEADRANTIIDEFIDDDLAGLPRDMLWLQAMTYLARTCEILCRTDAATVLYRALKPYSGMLATNGTIDAGPVDVTLGILASVVGDRDRARRHLEQAVVLARRIRAPLWLNQASSRL